MTDFSPLVTDQEIQLAMLNSPKKIGSDLVEPVAHAFDNLKTFPSLSEWTKHDIENADYSFNGIELNSTEKLNVTITMAEAKSGLKNILGKYSVDEQGTIRGVSVLVHNTRDVKSGDKYSFLQDGPSDNLQFFLISNGHAYNKSLEDNKQSNGAFRFVVNSGTEQERLAKITDDPEAIELVYQTEDKTTQVEGNVYHTVDSSLNNDNKEHSISGLATSDETTLRVGFEDFPNLGDRDFNDVVFDVNIDSFQENPSIVTSLNEIAPAAGSENLYDKFDDLLNNSNESLEIINRNNTDENGMSGMFANNTNVSDSEDPTDTASEYIDTLIDFAQVIEGESTLDNDIASFVHKTTTGDVINEEKSAPTQKIATVSSNNGLEFNPNEYTDYLI